MSSPISSLSIYAKLGIRSKKGSVGKNISNLSSKPKNETMSKIGANGQTIFQLNYQEIFPVSHNKKQLSQSKATNEAQLIKKSLQSTVLSEGLEKEVDQQGSFKTTIMSDYDNATLGEWDSDYEENSVYVDTLKVKPSAYVFITPETQADEGDDDVYDDFDFNLDSDSNFEYQTKEQIMEDFDF